MSTSRTAFDSISTRITHERTRMSGRPHVVVRVGKLEAELAGLLEAAHAEALREDAAREVEEAAEEDYCGDGTSCGTYATVEWIDGRCACCDREWGYDATPASVCRGQHTSTPTVSLRKAYVPAEAPVVDRLASPVSTPNLTAWDAWWFRSLLSHNGMEALHSVIAYAR